MDQRAWLWRKRSSEKTILATNKLGIPLARIEEEIQTYAAEKANETEKSGKNLNEKLAAVLLDSHVKGEPVTENEKLAEEAIAENGKPAEEAIAGTDKLGEVVLKQELDDALNECVQRLHLAREEQEKRIHDAVMMTSREYEKAQKKLEEKLRETSQQVANLAVENSKLNNVVAVKEKMIEELNRNKSQRDAEFSALMARLDSTEKENAFLRYEFHMLEKELEIRSEEMEYNRRAAAESHKQHLESVRIITKLEQECQRLHLLMRKRMAGPTALVNVKSETEMRRRKPNPTKDMIVRNASSTGNSPENTSNKKMRLMIDQLRDLEEENKTLREILTRKNSEILSSRTAYSRTASRLPQADIPNGISRSLRFDVGSDDGISSSESWASALISELEHFKNERLKSPQECKEIEVSDISLMDDFVEMEKLAIVSAGTTPNNGYHRCSSGRELVPVEADRRNPGESEDVRPENSFDWLQVVLKAMLEQKNVSKRSLDELFEDIKISLGYINQPTSVEDGDSRRAQSNLNARNKIKKHFGFQETKSDNGDRSFENEENSRLKDELKNMEASLHSETEKSEALMVQLEESRRRIESLETELESLREAEGMMEEQIENQKSINEDLDTQLSVAKAKLNEVFQKFSSLEVELEDKHNCCEDLEATCLELQLQLQSDAKTETLKDGINQEEKQSQSGWEITTASVKLAECQETILNLGKQLKALARPREAELFDKVFSSNSPAANAADNNLNRRSSLRDQMLAEDNPKPGDDAIVKSPKDKETPRDADAGKPSFLQSDSDNALSNTPLALVQMREGHHGSRHKAGINGVGSLAVVPSKKQGGFGFLRRLLLRRKKGGSKKPQSLA